jgi:hypothetical protein
MIDNSEHTYEDIMLFRNLNDEVMRKKIGLYLYHLNLQVVQFIFNVLCLVMENIMTMLLPSEETILTDVWFQHLL